MSNSEGHVWRWRDEDPQAIVLLVIGLVLLAALPLRGCVLGGAQGDARHVAHAATPSIEAGMESGSVDFAVAAAPAPVEAAPEAAPAAPAPSDVPPEGVLDPHAGHNHPPGQGH